jgi:alpha-L-rhamnosidase
MRFAETIQNDGSIYLANIRGAKVTDEYTTKGAGDEVYEPRFTYHGFRYVEVTGYPGEPTLDILEGLVVHDDVAPAGAFQCSNKLVNQIAKNIRWGTRGNYRSMPTDCPQRDERQGWLGDRSEESHGESYLFNISGLYGKWVGDMADSQRDDGSISDVCPAYWPLYNDNVTWPCTFIVAPGMLYKQYGDKRILEKHYDAMKKWILYMQKYLDNGILPKDNYGDWCVPPEEQHLIHSNDPARKTPGDFLGTSFYYHCLMLMSDYANVLGKQQDVNDFRALAEIVKTAFNKKFLDEGEAKYANGAETTCVLPLAFGLAPDSVREKLFGRLVDHIMNVGKGHLATGLVGGQFLMRTLSDNGRPDVAFTITTQTSYPSWGYMIDKNATTIWELWNGDTADPAMNSHNHVMLVGDLNTWFYEYLGGIRAASPGFKQITLRPYIEPGLQNVEASHKSPYGTIYSRWRTEKDRLFWQVTIPANTTARVYVPATDAAKVTESGKALADMPELRLVEVKDGAVVLDAGSGQYSFEVAR